MTTFDFQPLALDLAVAAAALIVFLVDLQSERLRPYVGPLTFGLLVAILGASFWIETSGTTAYGAYVGGPTTTYFKQLVLAAAALAVLGGQRHVMLQTPLRQGEYYFLLLISVLGMTLLPGARDLILLLVCFELMGIPLYVLAAFAKTDRIPGSAQNSVPGAASEASLKLYLVGAASTVLSLFGMSWVVGLAGGTSFAAIGAVSGSPMLLVGILMILAGMSFKVGVAPFHMWVPDTFQGSNTPFVAFLSSAPKVAGMAAIVLLFGGAFSEYRETWGPALLVLSPLTLIVGSLSALPQSNVKRLLAYSGVAHTGFLLMAFAVGTPIGLQMTLFYLLAYALTNVGVFLVAHAVASDGGDDSAASFDGLSQRSPWLGLALLLFLLSLAGIPFVAGFWAKLYVFIAVYQAGFLGLVALAALISVLALFYYLKVAKAAYVNEPVRPEPVRVAPGLSLAIVLSLLAIVGIGLRPAPFLGAAERAAQALTQEFQHTEPRPKEAPATLSLTFAQERSGWNASALGGPYERPQANPVSTPGRARAQGMVSARRGGGTKMR